jgi:hypothetical protein
MQAIGHVPACPCVTCRGLRRSGLLGHGASLALGHCNRCNARTVLDGACHNDACPPNVAARRIEDARWHGVLIGTGVGLALRWALFVGAVLLVVRSCS